MIGAVVINKDIIDISMMLGMFRQKDITRCVTWRIELMGPMDGGHLEHTMEKMHLEDI